MTPRTLAEAKIDRFELMRRMYRDGSATIRDVSRARAEAVIYLGNAEQRKFFVTDLQIRYTNIAREPI